MERIEQKQKVYEVDPAEAGDLVNALVNDGEWEGTPVPSHIMGITIAPHQEKSGQLMVMVVYAAVE